MFSKDKKKKGPAARPGKGNGSALSFIGPEMIVNGDIATEARLHVDGRIEGDVRCATLSQGESGTIAGNIIADEARLAGLVDGTVTARNLLLSPTARVTGDVAYETLSIESGAQVDGRFARRGKVAPPQEEPQLAAAAE